MKRVFSSVDSVHIGLLQSVLEAADIPCEVRNVANFQLDGPSLNYPMELWVLRDEDYAQAARLLDTSQPEKP
jgi:Putative prokaryotic signal transducing protein